jgi:hypothetical protein
LAGQSLALVQPQTLLPLVGTQALPAALPMQLPHSAWPSAHFVVVSPATHVVPSQQPPLHGWLALHAVVQTPCAVSQLVPVGHVPQPVTPARSSPLGPRSSPPPAAMSSPLLPSTLTVIASQPAASTRSALVAPPMTWPEPMAVNVTPTVWPAGYAEKSSSTVP